MLDLYTNIKLKRLEMGWNQTELAKLAGYSDKSMIAKIESGKIDLPQSKIKLFADIFHCSVSELMGWNEIDADNVPQFEPEHIRVISLFSQLTPEEKVIILNTMNAFISGRK